MILYEYYCDNCKETIEVFLKVDDRDKFVGMSCAFCKNTLRRSVGNQGGFRLGTNGKVGWANDGYATTYGDAENFKAGRKVY